MTQEEDKQLREQFPANVEGSKEFNETNELERLEDEKHQDEVESEQSQKPQLSQQQILDLYVNDPVNKENHRKIAQQLNKIFPQRWFTIDMVVAKTRLKEKKAAAEMMLALQLFKLCEAKDGGKNYKHQTKFRITLSVEDRLKVLQEYKDNHLKQIELIDQEIQSLTLEVKPGENIEK